MQTEVLRFQLVRDELSCPLPNMRSIGSEAVRAGDRQHIWITMTAPQSFSARSAPYHTPEHRRLCWPCREPRPGGWEDPNNAPSLPRSSPVLAETNSIL